MGTAQSSNERILLVDDDPAICYLLAKLLSLEGFEPVMCTHPREALAACERERFKLAFIDILLPEISGLELAASLKSDCPTLEVVFITGHGTLDSAVQAIKVGAYDFLRKPFNISELKLCLKRFNEREALKSQLRRVEQRYYNLVQHIPLIIFLLRENFQLEFINEASSVLLGYAPEEAVEDPNWLLDRIHGEDRQRIRNLLESAFHLGGAPFSAECRLLHKKGHAIYAIIKSIPRLEYENDIRPDQLEGIVVDITDRVFLEKALVQKEKIKTLGAISAEVAHEIRNPLMSIGGFAKRLASKYPDLPEIQIILTESQRLEKILDRIKDYLKPVEIQLRACSVNPVVINCLNMLVPETEQKSRSYCLDLDENLPLAHADPDVLAEVFILLMQKSGATDEPAESLAIKTFATEQNIHIEFKHPSAGAKVQNGELLLMPFAEGGQSIGLPLSHRLVKSLGGLLSVVQQDRYLILTVSLPIATPA